MSTIGTGIAAGVANTSLAAQQTAQKRDKRLSEARNGAKRMVDNMETSAQALEEGDESESPIQGHIDQELPDRQALPPDQFFREESDDAPQAVAEEAPSDQTGEARPGASGAPDGADKPSEDTNTTLYRHVDLTA